MGFKPKSIAVPPVELPPPAPTVPPALPAPVASPPAPQTSPSTQEGNAVARRAAALGASQGFNNTNLTGAQGIRFLEEETKPRTLLGL